jgi:glycosyltransferase involved in cell wall biosynthesis
MDRMAPRVVRHGRLDQAALADLFRRCRVFALPSFYEGLPLVLVEALACGCRLVATDLPGVREEIAGRLGDGLSLVPCPRLARVDVPREEDLPRFVDGLVEALRSALAAPPPAVGNSLAPFRWGAVFARIEKLWKEVVDDRHARGG